MVGADSMHFPLGRFSKAFASHHRVPSPRFRREEFVAAILRLVDSEQVDLVWPTCEEIFHLAAHHEEVSKRVRLFCEPLAALKPLHQKLDFARLAGEMAPESWSGDDAPVDRRLLWKPLYSRFAVRIGHEAPGNRKGWMAQEFLSGEEFSAWALCVNGEVRTLTFYDCPSRSGKGAGCAFEPMWDEPAAGFVTEIAGHRKFTGSLAFDFVRDATGRARVIECNPRLTSGLHVLDASVRITDLLEGPGSLPPPMHSCQLLLPTILSNPALMGTSPDIVSIAGDRGPALGQLAGLAELAGVALRRFTALTAAATRDLEYNGD